MKVTAAAAVASLGMASAFVTPGAFRATTSSLNKVRLNAFAFLCVGAGFDHARQLPWLHRLDHACWVMPPWQEDAEVDQSWLLTSCLG